MRLDKAFSEAVDLILKASVQTDTVLGINADLEGKLPQSSAIDALEKTKGLLDQAKAILMGADAQ